LTVVPAASHRAALNHHAGMAAESAVAARYLRAGFSVVARRWRGMAGEIDLICRRGTGLVFVEVKKSRSFALALERITPRQVARIFAAAAEFADGEPSGQNTEMRFDVAMVNSVGEIGVLENALGY